MEDLLKDLELPKTLLEPNKAALDDEFERHPADIAIVCDALAQATRVRDTVRANAKHTEFEARQRLISKWTRDGTKYTVGDLGAAVDDDSAVRQANNEAADEDLYVERLRGLLKALEAKTSALKHLSELWQSSYYTTSASKPRERVRARD